VFFSLRQLGVTARLCWCEWALVADTEKFAELVAHVFEFTPVCIIVVSHFVAEPLSPRLYRSSRDAGLVIGSGRPRWYPWP
jgi:hypothetical protein